MKKQVCVAVVVVGVVLFVSCIVQLICLVKMNSQDKNIFFAKCPENAKYLELTTNIASEAYFVDHVKDSMTKEEWKRYDNAPARIEQLQNDLELLLKEYPDVEENLRQLPNRDTSPATIGASVGAVLVLVGFNYLCNSKTGELSIGL